MNNKITKFLITCSGADKDTLDLVSIEKPKFVSIGAAILLTAILASLSGGYALFFSFNSVIASAFFGLLWALLIFNLDRYIIVSIDKNSPMSRQISMAIPRLLISFVLAITISKPLELRLFEGSVNSKLYEQDVTELNRYDSLVFAKKIRLKNELLKIEKQDAKDVILSDYNNSRNTLLKQQELILRNIRVAGTDTPRVKALTIRLKSINRQISSSDSMITRRKKQVYSGIEEIEMLDAGLKRRIYREIFVTDSLYPIQVQEMKDKQANKDLLIRLKALAELKSDDGTMNTVGNLITLLFILLEMSPVLIKLMAKKGLYEAAILAKQNELYLMATRPKPIKEEEKIVPVPEIQPKPEPSPSPPVEINPQQVRQIPTRGFFKND